MPMRPLHTRLVALTALSALSLASTAHADPFVARLAGSVAGVLIGNTILNGKAKKGSCRLYDRDGREVVLPCDPDRPIGEVMGPDRVVADASVPVGVYDEPGCDCAAASDVQPSYSGSRYGAATDAAGYDRYLEQYSYDSAAGGYSASYGGGYGYGEGYAYADGAYAGGVYPYGGVGYGQGGYGYGYPVSRAAGRDRAGYLTWPGKPAY